MRHLAIITAFALLAASGTARAQSVEEFYKGKTVNLLIGFSVGGGYDLYARHLARYMGKHIPGKPTIVPQNMAGAGSLRAASFLYSAAPKDGTAIGTFARTTGINPLLERRELRRHQIRLAWQRNQRHQRLCRLAHLGGEELEGFSGKAGDARRAGPELGAGHLRQSL